MQRPYHWMAGLVRARRHCARRQLVLKKKCRAQGLRRGIGSMGYAVMKGKQGRAGVPRNLGERNVGHPYNGRYTHTVGGGAVRWPTQAQRKCASASDPNWVRQN